MDTTTVLEIIKMIDNERKALENMFSNYQSGSIGPREMWHCQWIFKGDMVQYGALKALDQLQDHLLDFIEAQLENEENQTGE